MKLIIITGLSGSGKSVALNTLEDLGYYCIDNLPAFMLPSLAEGFTKSNNERFQLTAVGIDARDPTAKLDSISTLLQPLKEQGISYEIIFLEAQDETLIKRFSETRRRHPLSDEEHPLAEAILQERELLAPLLNAADLHIDTTHTNLHELRQIISSRISDRTEQELSLLFESFGFKHAVPRDADFVYDVRCLPNPHWQQSLRPLTGKDAAVAEFLEGYERVTQLKEDIISFLENWIPCFEADGRNYLTIAIGCTGGQHRSVYLTEQLATHFQKQNRQVQIRHRELP